MEAVNRKLETLSHPLYYLLFVDSCMGFTMVELVPGVKSWLGDEPYKFLRRSPQRRNYISSEGKQK